MTKQLLFNQWMEKTVQSLHYSDNEKMLMAYDRLEERD